MATNTRELHLAKSEFWQKWEAAYEGLYPHSRHKIFEHYASLFLADIFLGDKFGLLVDIAADQSPFTDKVEELDLNYRNMRHDLSYEAGVNGNRIGSLASDIPLPDNSVDYMTLHCSFEHFEGDEDTLFIYEASRVLKPGGRVAILPLYMWDHYRETAPQPSPNTGFARFYDEDALQKRILDNLHGLSAERYRVYSEEDFKFEALVLRKCM